MSSKQATESIFSDLQLPIERIQAISSLMNICGHEDRVDEISAGLSRGDIRRIGTLVMMDMLIVTHCLVDLKARLEKLEAKARAKDH